MRAKIWGALTLLVLLVITVVFWHARFLVDFWPIDASRVGPNLVASVIQWALILIAASLLYPPIRRAIDRWIKGHLSSANKELHQKLDLLHEKTDHIIKHHPDIPQFTSKDKNELEPQ